MRLYLVVLQTNSDLRSSIGTRGKPILLRVQSCIASLADLYWSECSPVIDMGLSLMNRCLDSARKRGLNKPVYREQSSL